jgi:excinuclease ABC subunit C
MGPWTIRVCLSWRKGHKLPLLPGVYIMKNKAGDIIYIVRQKL